MFNFHHSFFGFSITSWVWLVNTFLKVSVKTSLLPDYVLHDTADDDTPDSDNGINDNNGDKNYDFDNKKSNDWNHLYDDKKMIMITIMIIITIIRQNDITNNAFCRTFYLRKSWIFAFTHILTLFRMGNLGAAHGWREVGKKAPPP